MKFVLSLLIMGLINGCSESPGPGKKISMSFSLYDVDNPSKDKNPLPFLMMAQSQEPQSSSDINCVGVFVGYENLSNVSTCFLANDTVKFSHLGGMSYSTNGNFDVEVDNVNAGQALRAHVIGFKVDAATKCPDFRVTPIDDFDVGKNGVSQPYFLARNVPVPLPTPPDFEITATFDSSGLAYDCVGPLFDGASYASNILSQAPLYYVRFDEYNVGDTITSGNDVISARGSGLQVFGSSITVANGKIRNSMQAGSNYIGKSSSTGISFTTSTAFSIESWVKGSAVNAGTIVSLFTSSTNYIELMVNGSNKFEARMLDGSNTFSAQDLTGTDPTIQFHHVVLTYDGTSTQLAANLKLYINGVLKATGLLTNSAPTLGTPQSIHIGADATGSGFSGYIDDTSIYDKALSATQVLTNYNAGLND